MRKRWTAKTEVTETLIKFREKRKWQIALRRYVLEKNKASSYAVYFGLDVDTMRNWISSQFDETLTWDNFSTAWQFEHVVPLNYFDFSNNDDLQLCWNFINIRVEKLEENKNPLQQVDAISAKAYFMKVYNSTGFYVCLKMVKKIEEVEAAQLSSSNRLEQFLLNNKTYLDATQDFTPYEFSKLNEGVSLNEVLAEKALFKRFGG
ncbi:hypothetical protein [Foetidibacter luteolus]|uniref:hypothetical protein n=1 Tax=Foetidibacter luteolus TaxID=2608880 RepID=UPI00129B01B8|nr:hypothetical protein [Foetidibacter luteolus]